MERSQRTSTVALITGAVLLLGALLAGGVLSLVLALGGLAASVVAFRTTPRED